MRIKPIPNFPDYYISDTGMVLSKMRRAYQEKPKEYRKLATWLCAGYRAIRLQRNKKAYKRFIHRLLLETFVGKSPKGCQCRHLDGNSLNNDLNNLRWGTRSENQRDCIVHHTDHRGEKHGMSRLTNQQVLEIYKLAKKSNKKIRKIDNGGDYKKIGKMFKVAPSTIGHIARRSTWGWLTEPNEVEI